MISKIFRLLLACLIFCETSYAQDSLPITANWKHTVIGKVKREITNQTGLRFWDTIPETYFRVTLSVNKLPLRKVLDTIFGTREYTWKLYKDQISVTRQEQKIVTLSGKIINQKGEGLSYANIKIKETNKSAVSDEQGNFSIAIADTSFSIIITMVGYVRKEMRISGETNVIISLELNVMTPHNVFPPKLRQAVKDSIALNSSPIQVVPVYLVDSPFHRWTPSRNIADELSALTGVLLFNPNASPQLNQSAFTIRSRITIFGDPHPLIILNGMVYGGDLSNINTHDIETIAVIKDAAASARFGIRAGNGVLFITTRAGAYNTALKISAKVNTTVGQKPDLLHLHTMSSGDHIGITKMLYQNGHYVGILQNAAATLVPPVAEILYKKDRGQLSDTEAEAALNDLRNTDTRKEAMKYLYRRSLHQQYHLDGRGGDSTYHYYFSFGYDIGRYNLKGNDDSRYTINLGNAIKLGKSAPEINFNLYLSQSMIHNNGIDIMDFLFPYEKLADEQGNPLPVTQTVRQGYKDSLSAGPLLDWYYKPLDELREKNNQSTKNAFLFTTGIKYRFWEQLEANISFRFEKESDEQENKYPVSTYLTRNLINQYTQINSAGMLSRPIPVNDIVDENLVNRNAQNMNVQLNYEVVKKKPGALLLNFGSEMRHIRSRNKRLRRYGVSADGTPAIIDYTTRFSLFHEPAITNTIPHINSQADTTQHFYSFFFNGMYNWKKRFSASFTIRKDESNIFGVRAHQKGVPLMSAGIGWDISQERFYRSNIFSQLRVRLSTGYCGNISRSFSALTGLQAIGTNPWGAPYSVISNAPNSRLSPETVRISNIGLDFSLLNNRIWGSAEYFEKVGTNLLGLAPIDPTAGVSVFQGNVASMKGHGIELTLHSKTGHPALQWLSMLTMSYARDKVTKYTLSLPSIAYYPDTAYMNPKEGKPLYSMYSLDFRGLDPANGDPIGALNGFETKDYAAILHSPDFTNLIYHGPATPVFYGSFRNTIIWKRLELRFNITWKAGYYFRRNSIKYTELFDGLSIGHSDITRRWQVPGDELHTNIPSLQFPGNYARDFFYSYSTVLVEKGDHIRLQDIRLTYSMHRKSFEKRRKISAEVFVYVNNVGLIWRANDKGIDPDYANRVPAPLTATAGIKLDF